MGSEQREVLIAGAILAALVASVGAAVVQSEPRTSETLKSESPGPRAPRPAGWGGPPNDPPSEKLDRPDGVTRPPANIAPDMSVRPPVPDPGTTPVIPAPGSPGGD